MAIKQKITCDISSKVLKGKDLDSMTVINIAYKELGSIPDFKTKEPMKCLVAIDSYQFHISAEKSKRFMEKLKILIKELKKES